MADSVGRSQPQAGSSASNAQSSAPSIYSVLNQEEFERFGSSTFDEGTYLSAILKASANIPSTTAKLRSGAKTLENVIRNEVGQHHEKLLSQVGNLSELELRVLSITKAVQSLEASLLQLQSDLSGPQTLIRAKCRQLERMLTTCEMLRKISRYLFVVSRLKQLLQRPDREQDLRELPKAAQCVREIEQLSAEADLSGIEVLEADASWLSSVNGQLTHTSWSFLLQAISSHDQAKVALMLQVFYNLGTLEEKMNLALKHISSQITSHLPSLQMLLDKASGASVGTSSASDASAGLAAGISRGTAPASVGSSPALRTALWSLLDSLCDSVHSATIQMLMLHRLLTKLRDPTTHTPFIQTFTTYKQSQTAAASSSSPSTTESLLNRSVFWKNLLQIVSAYVSNLTKGSPAIEQILIAEYPRLLSLLMELVRRINSHYEVKQSSGGLSAEEVAALLALFSRHENNFLKRSFARLLGPVNTIFPSPTTCVLAPEEAATFARVLAAELDQVRADVGLLNAVTKLEVKVLQTFVAKCESSIISGEEAVQLEATSSSPVPNTVQLKNANFHFCLRQVHSAVNTLTLTLPSQSAQLMQEALEYIERVCTQIMRPLLLRLTRTIERTIAQGIFSTGQPQSKSSADPSDDLATASPYVRAVTTLVSSFSATILPRYGYTPLTHPLRQRVVDFTLRQMTLFRPLTEAIKLKFAGDVSQIELALSPLPLPPLKESISDPFLSLRALKTLFYRETSALANASAEKPCPETEVLSFVVLLQHLVQRAPAELQSPHNVLGMNVSQYNDWVDEKLQTGKDKEIWKVFRTALEDYAKLINQRGEKQFSPVYPIFFAWAKKFSLE